MLREMGKRDRTGVLGKRRKGEGARGCRKASGKLRKERLNVGRNC